MHVSNVPLTFYALFHDREPMATARAASIWDVVAEAGRREGKAPAAVAWWEVDIDDKMGVLAVREDERGVSVWAERMEEGWEISWEIFQPDVADDRVTLAEGDVGDQVWEGRQVTKMVMWQALQRLALASFKTWERGGDPLADEA